MLYEKLKERGVDMKKSMFSLMLMDSIVKEIDRLAYEQGTNRSNLVNHILAEYLQMTTPEMQIKDIFNQMTAQLSGLAGFKVQSAPSDFCIAIKSPLEYKYRPTIKYSVEIYRTHEVAIGELRVVFRTQHNELLSLLSEFLELWIKIEAHYIHKYFKNGNIRYNIDVGRFMRTFMLPAEQVTVTNDLLSKAIGDYIEMFDSILKFYIGNPRADSAEIERRYVEYIKNGMIII